MLLCVNTDHIVLLCHIGAELFIGKHLDLKRFQHFRRAQLVDPSVIAEGGLHIVQSQKALQAKGGGDGVRVREIMRLYVDMLPLA